jgi:hypothetical protein
MNKRRRRRILRLRLSAGPREKGVYRPARKLSLKIIGASVLVALVAAGALGFAALNLARSKNIRFKHAPSTQIALAKATASPLSVESQSPVVAKTSPPQIAPSPSASVAVAQPSASIAAQESASIAAVQESPVSVPTPASEPSAVANFDGNDDRHEQKTPSQGLRKTAEQARREAERKRAHLEAMYKKHLISEEEYKKGQSEYQEAISKYRNAVGGGGSVNE